MNKVFGAIALSCFTLLAACSDKGEDTTAQQQPAQQTTQQPAADHAAHPAGHPDMAAQAPAQGTQYQAKVTKVTHAAGYTYLELDFNGKTTWLAASPVNVKTGDTVAWSGGAVMRNFTSKTLRRTFDEIIFVNAVAVVN